MLVVPTFAHNRKQHMHDYGIEERIMKCLLCICTLVFCWRNGVDILNRNNKRIQLNVKKVIWTIMNIWLGWKEIAFHMEYK